MYKWISGIILVSLIVLSGCFNSTEDDDIAAVVRGEDILVRDLRLLYPDDTLADMVDGTVKAKLAEQEIQKMDKDISKQLDEILESYGTYPQDDDASTEAASIRAFADPQAKKLSMDPHTYYEEYARASAEMTAYIQTYIDIILGGMEDDEFGIEEYHIHANEVLDELVRMNRDRIDILIK